MKKPVLVLLTLIYGLISQAQTDTAFWFAAPDISSAFNYDRPVFLRITAYQQPCNVTISQPANGGLPDQNVFIPANTMLSIDLTNWISNLECTPGNVIQNKGIKITSDNKIAAYYEVNVNGPNPELFALKGKNALGVEFYISSQYILGNSPVLSPLPISSFNIVATEDNTLVTITPSKNIVGHSANVPFVITLNRGQTYAAIATSQAAAQHLQGSHVSATKPVAITLADDLLQGIAFGGSCEDLAGDQTVPLNIIGSEYIAVKSNLNSPSDKVYITATQNGTSVSQDGVLITTLNAGASTELTVTNISTYIQSTAPVYAYQLSGMGCEVGAALLPKINCTGSSSVSVARSTNGSFTITLLVKNGGQSNFLVNGASGVITAAQFSAVPATGGVWYAAKVTLPISTYPNGSVIRVTNSSHIFQLGIFQGDNLGVGVGYFSDFNSLQAHASASTQTLCAGSAIQLAAELIASATYNWTGPGGFNSNVQNPVINNATVAYSGMYKLTVTVPGCGTYQDSVTVTVNSCPNGISNIINTYTPVLALNPCYNKITVEDAFTFNTGDTVLIIQMKGAVIDLTNSANFGTITDYKNAGNYEFNYVKNKSGNIIELKNNLTKQYDIPAGKVQLVRVPYYTTATVTSTLTCLPWDGSKGGILVLNARDNVDLAANIDVTGKGFLGGNSPNPFSTTLYCNNNAYYYAKGNLSAAAKGEGIAIASDTHAWGKGSAANGGGGGNGHNSGGGGGGNGGAGGFGGYQLEACGNAPFDNRGFGGKGLTYNNAANKIFMGGGGGSGHTDNATGSTMPGGNGGGIIIIKSPVINTAGFQIKANGGSALQCSNATNNCHDGSGGGGAGGTILIENTNFTGNTSMEVSGGKGGDLVIFNNAAGAGRIGPGGGGGAGIVWVNSGTLPPSVTINKNGGTNGVITQDNNNPWGATSGQAGVNIFNLIIPFDNILFKPNIDSVRIKSSAVTCTAFDFKGFGYTNTNPVATWQWYFGDGGTANTQNTSHTYSSQGNYTVKLVVTDINGCTDSSTVTVTAGASNLDFFYKQDLCDPLSIQFFSGVLNTVDSYWSFGDGVVITGDPNPVHQFPSLGNYTIKYFNMNSNCADTITKIITIALFYDDIVFTPDTIICPGASKQLRSNPSLNFCWSSASYLDNPYLANPISSPPLTTTYYLNAEYTGNNLVVNGDFNNGNTGFISGYTYATSNVIDGQYFVGTNPQAWNAAYSNCKDHSTGTGNMLLVNSSNTLDENVWKQTITVTPNTNYAFSIWIQTLLAANPAQLQLSINGKTMGSLINSGLPACTWKQFHITWNSGNSSSAIISIVNKNSQPGKFALDDILFAPVFIKRDSAVITIDNPVVKTNKDTSVCPGTQVQLNTTGAINYTWTPVTGLSNPNIANPVATVNNASTYIVSGTTTRGCIVKDTVVITTIPKPLITKSNDTSVCRNSNIQLFATGGVSYLWSPSTGLSNPNVSNPVATPSATTVYFVTVTAANTCSYKDSIKLTLKSPPVFSISPDQSGCAKDPKQLTASGGTSYLWQPSTYLNNPSIANPVATPDITTTYSVKIKDNTCNDSAVLTTTVTVLPLPSVQASKTNDVDCSSGFARLSAVGGVQYIWQPSAFLNDPNISNPIATPLATTLFTVTGTDSKGCKNTDTITVNVSKNNSGQYNMPNAFTPNNDGLNECFGLKYWGNVTKLDFSIYDRLGVRIFYTTDPAKCWDGRYKGIMQENGMYVYVIKATTLCSIVDKKGTFTLLR